MSWSRKKTMPKIKHNTTTFQDHYLNSAVLLELQRVCRHLPLMLHNALKDQMVGITFPFQEEENGAFTKPWQLAIVTHTAGASAWMPEFVSFQLLICEPPE